MNVEDYCTCQGLIEEEKENKAMEEKDLWQNIDDGVCVGVEEPGGISYKEDLVKEGKEGIEANEGPHPTNQQGQNSHPDIGLLKKATIAFSKDVFEKG